MRILIFNDVAVPL